MVIKDTSKIHENFNMDNNHHHHHQTTGSTAQASPSHQYAETPTPLIVRRKGILLSFTTIVFLVGFFICTVLTVGFLMYNFAPCDKLKCATSLAAAADGGSMDDDDNIVCTRVRQKNHNGMSNHQHDFSMRRRNDSIRLPRSIRPMRYNITLAPYLFEGNFTFDGHVEIHVKVLEDCFNITMHALDMNISKSDVQVLSANHYDGSVEQQQNHRNHHDDGGSNNGNVANALRIRKQYFVEDKHFFIIELYDKLKRDQEYKIRIKFSGIIRDYLQGFYRSFYKVNNATRWIASTQFEPTDARRAFPCFDEPGFKAQFTLNIARPKNMLAISNMPVISTTKHATLPNYVWDHFKESVPMSTYLVAYAITDFEYKSKGNFSVWARAEAIRAGYADYALDIGTGILKFLEEFFDIGFPLPKMDMIALPDFQAGAMENWGLVTYRETAMLFEEGVSAVTNKQRAASVIGHELAHQWFGNLVTMKWWNDLWLNEGFASYMEYLTVDAVRPEWRTLDQFVVSELQAVFQLDALSSSHQISVEVHDPDEISEIFDRISYTKGSTIIRMMSHFLTSNVFRRGLAKYLSGMAYSSAEQNDLWRFLTEEARNSGLLDSKISVKEVMDTWTLQVGYPVVKISRDPNRNVVRLEQSRFLFVNESNSTKRSNANSKELLWWIPITYTTSERKDFVHTQPITWVPRTKIYEIENQELANAKWFIFNIQQTAYYRANYELSNWHEITKHLMDEKHYTEIAPANRAQLIDDSLNLARAAHLPYDVAMNLSRYLVHELDYVPWKSASTAFNFIDSMFVNQGDYDLLKEYFLHLIKNVYHDVGFEDERGDSEDMLKLLKRVDILGLACHLGHRHCISESVRHFNNWMEEPNPDVNNPVSPNLRATVYCSAIQYGTEQEWNFAFERYLKTPIAAEKEILLSALGCSREPWILFRYLRRSLDVDIIRKQDVYRVFASVSSSNVIGQQIAFDFIRNNWQQIKAYLGPSMSDLYTIIKFATKRMNSKFALAELEAFVNNDLKENPYSIQQSIEQVRVNVDWMNRNYDIIVNWLKQEAVNFKHKLQ